MSALEDIRAADLPPRLAHLVEIIGLAATIKLVEVRGGTRLYVPRKPDEDRLLVKIIGRPAAAKLVRRYGGDMIEVDRGLKALRAVRDWGLTLAHFVLYFSKAGTTAAAGKNMKCAICQVELNTYDDATAVPAGYVQVPRIRARGAPHTHTVLTGWGGKGKFRRPRKEAVVPEEWFAQREALRARAKKEPSPARLAALAEKRRAKIDAEQARLRERWLPVVTEVCAQKKFSFGVETAIDIVLDRIKENTGVAKAYCNGEFAGSDFAFIAAILGAAQRHAYTNYDELLRAGIDRDTARELKE